MLVNKLLVSLWLIQYLFSLNFMMDVLKSKLVIAKSLLESKTNFLNYKKKKKKLLTFSLFTLFSVNFLKSNDCESRRPC